jgi:hypothetical protein
LVVQRFEERSVEAKIFKMSQNNTFRFGTDEQHRPVRTGMRKCADPGRGAETFRVTGMFGGIARESRTGRFYATSRIRLYAASRGYMGGSARKVKALKQQRLPQANLHAF